MAAVRNIVMVKTCVQGLVACLLSKVLVSPSPSTKRPRHAFKGSASHAETQGDDTCFISYDVHLCPGALHMYLFTKAMAFLAVSSFWFLSFSLRSSPRMAYLYESGTKKVNHESGIHTISKLWKFTHAKRPRNVRIRASLYRPPE